MSKNGLLDSENGTVATSAATRKVENAPAPGAPAPAPAASEHSATMDLPLISGAAATGIGAMVLLLLGGLFLLGWGPHARGLEKAEAQAKAATDAKPLVDVITARGSKQDEVLMLPADVRPNQMTNIYARTSGYLAPLPEGIDIGARVEAGQVIAKIAAPEVDAELEQARAALEQAKAATVVAEQQSAFNKTTLARYESALKNRAVADLDVEERRTQLNVSESMLEEARANVVASEAAVNRLRELQSFQTISAPFAGVLTARGYDAGALIKGDEIGERAMFRLEQTDVLRVSVSVPQSEVTNVRLGQEAELIVRNYPGRPFKGTVARTAAALNAGTRTMLVEVDVPNAENLLLPGMYGQVRFSIRREHQTLIVPTSAMVYGAEGVRLVVIEDGHARYRTVTLGRDFGVEAEVTTGISATDQLVNNPGDLKDGAAVTVRAKSAQR